MILRPAASYNCKHGGESLELQPLVSWLGRVKSAVPMWFDHARSGEVNSLRWTVAQRMDGRFLPKGDEQPGGERKRFQKTVSGSS